MMVDNYNSSIKLKRKDYDSLSDDFLSSPALKIRRLDVELPPIIEEEEAEIQFGYDQWMSEVSSQTSGGLKPLEYEEKAIVVFQPVDPSIYSTSKFSVDPNLISSFKNQVLLGSHLNLFTPNEEDEAPRTGDNTEGNMCKAVIPWVSSQQLNQRFSADVTPQAELSVDMDAEGPETSAMEVEDAWQQESGYMNHSRLNEIPHQEWQHQHCMIPQPPHNIATPIVWYR